MMPTEPDAHGDAAAPTDDEELPWPVGFIVIAGLAALYIGWRLIQLIVQGIAWIF